MTVDYFIELARDASAAFYSILAVTHPAEILAALVLPLLSLLLGIRANHYIDSRPMRTVNAKVIDYLAPLIGPVLAIFFTAFATIMLRHLGHNPVILSFVMKLCGAWLAIYAVRRVTSGYAAGAFITLVILPVTLLHLFGVWEETTALLNDATFTFGNIKFNLFIILKTGILLCLMLWTVGLALNTTEQRLRRIRTMRASNRTLILKFLQIALYIIVFLFALNMVGVSLTALSVFSGALGVGIGLGLQKIASNFISGIILLFEKSIEVGDLIVLQDGTRGFVRHTSARYSLIEKSDGSEVFVPNETFISQQVTNYTHSTHRARGQVLVGVGYHSDLEQVLELLLQAAGNHPRCAKDPAPSAFVLGFGDSAVNMQLDFWVEDVENGLLGVTSDIYIAIVKSFRTHGIEIPYPHQVALHTPTEPPQTPSTQKPVTARKARKEQP